jgi:hypothetical protein
MLIIQLLHRHVWLLSVPMKGAAQNKRGAMSLITPRVNDCQSILMGTLAQFLRDPAVGVFFQRGYQVIFGEHVAFAAGEINNSFSGVGRCNRKLRLKAGVIFKEFDELVRR